MPKTIRNIFDQKLTFEKLIEAEERASLGKKKRKEIILFEMDLETNITKILNEIKSGNYRFGNYREFIIYEPKKRLIKSLPYRDRIVHQWYIVEFIKPFYFPRFIRDSYACIDNRGTHAAVLRVQKYMRKMKKTYGNYYVLKCDIKKFFYSINIDILISILSKKIKDKKLFEFTKLILQSKDKKGIPIGNYTSQFFANIYLNELDYYIKDVLKIKYYVRYMDDFILLLDNKEKAKEVNKKINDYVCSKLDLELNRKTRYYPSKEGIDFCGYRIFENYILLRKRFKRKMKKTIKKWNKLYHDNKINMKKMELSYNSFLAHASHANSYNYICKIKDEIKNIK